MKPLRVLICPEYYQGGTSAQQAAQVIADALAATSNYFQPKPLALALDRHTIANLTELWGGSLQEVVVLGKGGRPERVTYGLIHNGRTVLLMPRRMSAARAVKEDWVGDMTSFGVGQLLKAVLQHRSVERVCLYLSEGTWPVDGGVGLLQALGVRFQDLEGHAIGWGVNGLSRLSQVDFSQLLPQLQGVSLTVGCDVMTPLLGRSGAAQRWGKRAGAQAPVISGLEQRLTHFTEVLRQSGKKELDLAGCGAGGGLGYGLALLGAQLEPGLDLLLENLDFSHQVRQADLVITGQAHTDRAGQGIVPTVLRVCEEVGTPAVVLSGSVDPEAIPQVLRCGAWAVLDAMPAGLSAAQALARVPEDLYFAAQQVGRLLLLGGRLGRTAAQRPPQALEQPHHGETASLLGAESN
ncbi:glycerate kinase [Anthocerotibacter panamensis]|uniref:glycerate kinase n=1 Tax=Anthocerotibacter panamensis TaxID=2857077 RepID=UPI001C4070C9|nr:glycerate kinase [Anthocerotibacter panamensis]